MTYSHEAVLRDGASVMIRDVRGTDRAAIHALFARMSSESVRHRFFVAKRELTPADLVWLDRLDSPHVEVALAAVVRDGDGGERVLGIGRYTLVAARIAEIAFDVGDADQGRGIGTLLLEHLARVARAHDIATFRAEVEADNVKMLDVFERSGFVVSEALDAGVYRVEFPIAETEAFLKAAAARERRAGGGFGVGSGSGSGSGCRCRARFRDARLHRAWCLLVGAPRRGRRPGRRAAHRPAPSA
jgi:GNAT superfamily N-acetyltransferase